MDKSIIEKTEQFVKETLKDEATGHDFHHIERVRQNALKIAKEENADLFVVELAALLHDLDDWKINANSSFAEQWLGKLNIDKEIKNHVLEIIKEISFKGASVENKIRTKEGKAVQDADRLDAIGAIGIARCFATGQKLGNPIYDPKIEPKLHSSFEEYKSAKSTSINHFHQKLLLLKDRMNTETGKRLAEERHQFMENFLNQFFKELGKD